MPKYPIVVPIPSSVVRKFTHSVAKDFKTRIEQFINESSKDRTGPVLTYSQIASDLGINRRIVRDFLEPIGGGSNGITIHNPKFDER